MDLNLWRNFPPLLMLIVAAVCQEKSDSELQKGDRRSTDQCACQSSCTMGAPGIPGINGLHGKDGAHGMTGQPGIQGPLGPPGSQGMPGSRGRKGNPGVDGLNGEPGTSVVGPKGQKGEAGGPVRFSRHSGRDNIAFSVTRRNKLGPVTDDTRVMFDKIYSNLGDSFDTRTSEFKVKGNGTYIFHLHVMSQEFTECYAYIMLNDQLHLPVHGDARNGYGTGSTSVILDLAKDDKIWIQLSKGSALTNAYTVFSGYLLQ